MAETDSTMISNAANGYKYTPLKGAQSFRLLQILPAGKGSEDIHCAIDKFDRKSDQCPPYIALSYTWGDANVTLPMTLNGRPFSVTTNLHSALIHLRRMMPNMMVWIDALCIDQEHPEERGHQVAQMRAIYSDAKRVITWLGPAPDWGDVARLFAEMEAHHRICTRDFAKDGACASFYGQESVELLRYLGGSTYWTRIWIVQEIVVAKRLMIMCGHNMIKWHVFAKFLDLAYYHHFDDPAQQHDRSTWLPVHSPTIIGLMHWPLRGVTLADALSRTSQCKATDPRDKVYAILGLVDTGSGQNIEADYTMSLCGVYRQAILTLYTDSNVLKAAVACMLGEQPTELPVSIDQYYEPGDVDLESAATSLVRWLGIQAKKPGCPDADCLFEQLFPTLFYQLRPPQKKPPVHTKLLAMYKQWRSGDLPPSGSHNTHSSPCGGSQCGLNYFMRRSVMLARGKTLAFQSTI
jgi:hypothetical protein